MWLLSLKHLILRAFQVYKIPIVNGMVWWYASLKPAVGHRNNIVIVNRGNGNLTEIQLQTFQADFCLIRCGHYGSTRTKMFTSNHYFEYLSPKTSDTRQLLVIFHFMTTFHKFVIVFLIPMQICWYTGSAWTCHTAVILSILKPKTDIFLSTPSSPFTLLIFGHYTVLFPWLTNCFEREKSEWM